MGRSHRRRCGAPAWAICLPMRVMQCLCSDRSRSSPISGARTQAKPAIVAGLVKCKRVSLPRPSHENPTKRAQRGRKLRRLRLDADRRVPDREDGDVVVGQAPGHDVHHLVAARAAAVGTQLRRQVQGGLAGRPGGAHRARCSGPRGRGTRRGPAPAGGRPARPVPPLAAPAALRPPGGTPPEGLPGVRGRCRSRGRWHRRSRR
jgi:hypothetical protein